MITAVHGERRRLRKRFAAHGTEIRPLAGVYALMHYVILAMCEALAAHVADQRPRPVHRLMRGQRLGGHKLFGTRVAGIRHGLGGNYRTTTRTRTGTGTGTGIATATATASASADNTEITGYYRIDRR